VGCIILAHSNIPEIQTLINSNTPANTNALKYQIHKNIWPEIDIREKRVGFEGAMKPGMNNSKPDFMIEFNRQYITSKVNSESYLFSKNELVDLLVVTHCPK
jgi:hypothetical protein